MTVIAPRRTIRGPLTILTVLSIMTIATLLPDLASPPLAHAGVPDARLQLRYHAVSGAVDRAVSPLLAAFAREYGPEGLDVRAAGPAADRAAGVRPLARGSGPLAPGMALTLADPEGRVLLALPADALDLYAVYRVCERELRGRERTGYPEHVRHLLEARLAADDLLIPLDDRPLEPASAVLAASTADLLFLPPGCGPCLIARHEAAVRAAVASAPDRPVLAFEAAAVAALDDLGWRGRGYLLPLDAGARILGLRQGGSYRPLLVRHQGSAGIAVATLPTPEERP